MRNLPILFNRACCGLPHRVSQEVAEILVKVPGPFDHAVSSVDANWHPEGAVGLPTDAMLQELPSEARVSVPGGKA